jgi:hypothetical protein
MFENFSRFNLKIVCLSVFIGAAALVCVFGIPVPPVLFSSIRLGLGPGQSYGYRVILWLPWKSAYDIRDFEFRNGDLISVSIGDLVVPSVVIRRNFDWEEIKFLGATNVHCVLRSGDDLRIGKVAISNLSVPDIDLVRAVPNSLNAVLEVALDSRVGYADFEDVSDQRPSARASVGRIIISNVSRSSFGYFEAENGILKASETTNRGPSFISFQGVSAINDHLVGDFNHPSRVVLQPVARMAAAGVIFDFSGIAARAGTFQVRVDRAASKDLLTSYVLLGGKISISPAFSSGGVGDVATLFNGVTYTSFGKMRFDGAALYMDPVSLKFDGLVDLKLTASGPAGASGQPVRWPYGAGTLSIQDLGLLSKITEMMAAQAHEPVTKARVELAEDVCDVLNQVSLSPDSERAVLSFINSGGVVDMSFSPESGSSAGLELENRVPVLTFSSGIAQ